MEKIITKVGKAPDFCPENLINELNINANNHKLEFMRKQYKQSIDMVRSYSNPVEPPQCMKLFSGALEEVSDMRYFLHNKEAAIGIIYIDTNTDIFNCLNLEQMSLYKNDTVRSGQLPHFPGLYYASYIEYVDDAIIPDVHEWKSVTNTIMESLSKILYWIKFSELTGIDLDMSTLNGPMKRMYDMIIDNKDEFMKDYRMIAFDGNE